MVFMFNNQNTNDDTNVKAAFKIINKRGLHTRPSTALVKCSNSFMSKIKLYYKDFEVDAKNLIDVMMLSVNKGEEVTIEAKGSDAKKAIDALLTLANNKFNMSY
jgi:phosphocarrier protein HPr